MMFIICKHCVGGGGAESLLGWLFLLIILIFVFNHACWDDNPEMIKYKY